MNKWNARFMKIAQEVATWSKDPDKQVGAVIVSPDNRQVVWGYNGFPRSLDPGLAHDNASKNAFTVHAELNAILNATVDIRGWTIYVTHAPCVECAKAIIQAGITEVWVDADGQPKHNSKWAQSVLQAHDAFRTCGLHVDYI